MTRVELQALIDRVIGTKGIMRSSAWWVRKLFNKVLEYVESYADKAARADSKMSDTSTNAVSNKVIKEYVDNSRDVKVIRMAAKDNYELNPGIYYYWGPNTRINNAVTITLREFNADFLEGSALKTYTLDFIAGTSCQLNFSESLFWEGGKTLIFENGQRYLIKIVGFHIIVRSKSISRAVKDYVDESINNYAKVEFKSVINTGTQIEATIEPNKYYRWANALESLSISLATPKQSMILNNYMFEFVCSPVGCSLTLPSDIKWANGKSPELIGGTTCQVSIINKLAVFTMFE